MCSVIERIHTALYRTRERNRSVYTASTGFIDNTLLWTLIHEMDKLVCLPFRFTHVIEIHISASLRWWRCQCNCLTCFPPVIPGSRAPSHAAGAGDKPSRGPQLEQLLPVAVWTDGEGRGSPWPRHLTHRPGHMLLEERALWHAG